jgi:excisionase family DNA binding protein
VSETVKELYTRKDAAAALSLHYTTIDMLIHTGRLRAIRNGRRVFVHRAEIERFAAKSHRTLWPPKQNGKTVSGFVPRVVEESVSA